MVKAVLLYTYYPSDTPTLVYTSMNATSRIFNFSKLVKNIDVKTFLDNSILSCDCTDSPFLNKDITTLYL